MSIKNRKPAVYRAVLRLKHGQRIVVRKLAKGDTRALQGFNAALKPATRNVFYPHSYAARVVGQYIQRAQQGDDLTYLALADNRVVGYCFLWEFKNLHPHLGIGIIDAYQGQGLGIPLMKILIDDARKTGRQAVELTTALENKRAFRFYRHLGFQHIGDVKNISGSGDTWIEHAMFFPLQAGAKPSLRPFKPPV